MRATGLPLTLNAVVHRQNLHHLPAMFELAMELDAHRIEIAHVQYYGWAYENRAALLPTPAQLEESLAIVERPARPTGAWSIDYVVPDYYARRPKACMGGWGQRFFNITPTGKVLPCHAAETITGLSFDIRAGRSLREIWESSEAFQSSAAPTGCRSPAGPASGARSTGAAAAARPSRSPATPATPTRPASSRPTTA